MYSIRQELIIFHFRGISFIPLVTFLGVVRQGTTSLLHEKLYNTVIYNYILYII